MSWSDRSGGEPWNARSALTTRLVVASAGALFCAVAAVAMALAGIDAVVVGAFALAALIGAIDAAVILVRRRRRQSP